MANLVKFREQEIQTVIQDGVEMVPIKPICEALNLDYKTQYDKVKEDEILSQLWGLAPTTGKDNKTYKMVCLPLEFVFGWLFSISDQANDTFKKYKLECYHILYNHFVGRGIFEMKKQLEVTRLKNDLYELKASHKEEENIIRNQLQKAERMDWETYQAKHNQLKLPFNEN